MWQIIDRFTGILGSLFLAGLVLKFLAKAEWRKIVVALAAMGLFWLAGEMVKLGIAAPRPCWAPAARAIVQCPASFSFPSGHALAAGMAWVFVGLTVRRRFLWILGGSWVVLVAGMRILTGIHAWIDVWGGMIMGGVFGWIIWRWYYGSRE